MIGRRRLNPTGTPSCAFSKIATCLTYLVTLLPSITIDPRHFQHELNSYLGAAFSFQPTLRQSAWFRPHNRSEDFDNLYFVGAGTHPGAGLPGVLSSAIIAERLICGPPLPHR